MQNKIKNNMFFFLILLVLGSCKNQKNEPKEIIEQKNNSTEIKLDSPKNITPIFLTLSPRMSDQDFSSEIMNLNNSGKLENNKFILEVDNKNYTFDVQKINNCIRLKYSEIHPQYIPELNYQKSDKLLKEINYKKEKLLYIFKSKYKLNKVQIPININLSKYHLLKDNYILFKDDNKVVLFGYSNKGDSVASPTEREEEIKKMVNVNPDLKLLIYMASGPRTDSDGKVQEYIDFGIEFEINYYHKEEINSLLENMYKESEILKNIENEKLKNKLKKEKIKSNNLKEI